MSYLNTNHYLPNAGNNLQLSSTQTQGDDPNDNDNNILLDYSSKTYNQTSESNIESSQLQISQFKDEEYENCPNCNRRFFMGRLKLHLKSCKEGKPLKKLKSTSNDHDNTQELAEQGNMQQDRVPISTQRTKSFQIKQLSTRNSMAMKRSPATQEDVQKNEQYCKNGLEEADGQLMQSQGVGKEEHNGQYNGGLGGSEGCDKKNEEQLNSGQVHSFEF